MPTLDHFSKSKHFKSYAAGTVIFNEGDISDGYMYAVREGQVDIITHGEVLETVEPGGIFGEMGLIDDEPRYATAIAKTDCKVVPVDQYHFFFLIDEAPMFAITLMRTLAHRLRRITDIHYNKR